MSERFTMSPGDVDYVEIPGDFLWDDGHPVRFQVIRLGARVIFAPVYSSDPGYAAAPIEEGRHIDRIDIARRPMP
jgi:hypothetical protein